jgi:hypothetical protein
MSGEKKEAKPLRGIQWPVASDGDRSSTETAKAIWARSFAQLDKSLVAQLESELCRFCLLVRLSVWRDRCRSIVLKIPVFSSLSSWLAVIDDVDLFFFFFFFFFFFLAFQMTRNGVFPMRNGSRSMLN